MRRTYLVDDSDLMDPAGRWGVFLRSQPSAPPQRKSAELSLFHRPGVSVERGGWEPRTLALGIGVMETSEASVEANADALFGLLSRASTVSRVVGDQVLTAAVVGVDISDPNRVSHSQWHLEAVFRLQPFWSEANAITSAVKLIPGSVTFAEWAGSTGDVVDGVLRVRGPLTRCSVTSADGRGLSFEYELTASQYAFIDPVTMTAWRGGSSQWTPSANLIPLDYPAAGTLVLTPGGNGVALTVTAEGTDPQTSGIVLRGRRWWL